MIVGFWDFAHFVAVVSTAGVGTVSAREQTGGLDTCAPTQKRKHGVHPYRQLDAVPTYYGRRRACVTVVRAVGMRRLRG